MNINVIYEEKIFAKGFTIILGITTTSMFFSLLYVISVQSYPDRLFLIIFFLIMFLLFLVLTFNFSQLTIIMTSESIAIGFGLFKKTIMWDNIKNCYQDEASAIRYGGFGIRISNYKGKTRLVYNVMKAPRVVLSIKEGNFEEFVFSTKNPEKIIKIVKQYI